MIYKRNLSFPLAPTFEEDEPKKKKKKVKTRKNLRGQTIIKEITPREKGKPAAKTPPVPKEKRTREQRQKEKELIDEVDKKYGIGKYAPKKPKPQKFGKGKGEEGEKRSVKKTVINPPNKNTTKNFKGKPKKGRYKGKGGGGSSPTCKQGLFGKFRKKCKLNV